MHALKSLTGLIIRGGVIFRETRYECFHEALFLIMVTFLDPNTKEHRLFIYEHTDELDSLK